MTWKFLADSVALIHGIWVVIVVLGPLIAYRWRIFRPIHIVMMLITFFFMISGELCPLTTLEQGIREAHTPAQAFSEGFIANYLSKTSDIRITAWTIFYALCTWIGLWYAVYTTLWDKK